MKTSLIDFKTPAFVGLVLSAPLALLEFVFRVFVRPDPRFVLDSEAFSGLLMLFGFLWIMPFVFVSVGKPLLREVTTGMRSLAHPLTMVRVALLVLIALSWGGMVVDQLPCFLAVPNCD